MTAWVGRLELHYGRLLRSRSAGYRRSELRFQRASDDRSCPLLSVVHRSTADPVRTEEGSGRHVVADASSLATGSPGGTSKAEVHTDATRAAVAYAPSPPLLRSGVCLAPSFWLDSLLVLSVVPNSASAR
jgi:hypothetical protein